MDQNLRNEIMKLSRVERILLVEEIWDTIAGENQGNDLPDELKKELEKRSKGFPVSESRTWEEIKAEFLKSA